jgi:flavin-dependent dehydrogenase
MSDATSDVLVLGGGLAGSAAAITLARGGRSVMLIEKEAKPQHKVCGEFLSQEALVYLRELGVDPSMLGAATINAVRFSGRMGTSEMRLPFPAMALTRRTLDEALLRVAEDAGTNVCRGHRVQSIVYTEGQWMAALQEKSSLSAHDIFLATGKHDLFAYPRPAGRQSDFIAFKMYYRLAPEQVAELCGHVELSLYRGGYGGLLLVEDDVANYCCVVQRKVFQRHGARWEAMLDIMLRECDLLRGRLAGATALMEKPLAISWIPYGFVRSHAAGMWSVGDQAAVIPSFTGDGMSIALHSGRLAAEMFLRGESAEMFQAKLSHDVSRQVSLATMVSRGLACEPWRTMMEGVTHVWPGILGVVAKQTRLPKGAMRSKYQEKIAYREAKSYNSL